MEKDIKDLIDSLSDQQKQDIIDHLQKEQKQVEDQQRQEAISSATQRWAKGGSNTNDTMGLGGKKIF